MFSVASFKLWSFCALFDLCACVFIVSCISIEKKKKREAFVHLILNPDRFGLKNNESVNTILPPEGPVNSQARQLSTSVGLYLHLPLLSPDELH